MIPQTVDNPIYELVEDHPFLIVELDGIAVAIGEDQPLFAYGGVYLQPDVDMEHPNRYTWIRPPLEQGRSPEKVTGYTGDPRVVDLMLRFIYDIAHDTVRAGRRPTGWTKNNINRQQQS